jgi:phosphatidylglycerophosphate synthase
MYAQLQRRPIKMRTALWSRALASLLVRIGITPNQISIMSSVFALIGALCFSLSKNIPARDAILLIGAASCIQLRLLCNMLDGLMAVECGKSTKTGELFNEFSDRISDVALFVAAGYAPVAL